uniref:Glycosyl transferase family 28 C-terminal domain-containing protein n=1 Tax=Candidatus Methanomethylicus mesodigestus TaxID=1867258 RepID=A0A7C3FA12_9CREN
MRIYFAPCGIALGHAGRCIPVAKTFRERGHEVYFSTYGEAVQFVKKTGFQVGEAPPIKLFEREDGSFDLRRTLSRGPRSLYNFTLQVGAELDLIEHFKPDLVISDSRLSTILASRMRRIIPVLILHQLRIMIPHKKPITDQVRKEVKSHVERLGMEVLGRLWKLSKVIIVPDFPPPYTIAKENVVPSYQYINKLRLVGPIIPKYPRDLPPTDEIRKSLGIDDRPLIFAAISGTLAEKRMIVSKLVEIFKEFPDSYNVVVTRGLSGVSAGCNNNYQNKRLKVFNWVDDRYKYLKACDLLITRGGHNTVSEAMYYGKPMIVIPTIAHSEHQGIADAVVKMRLGSKIQQEELSKEVLLDAVRSIIDSSYYFYNVKRAQQFSGRFNAVETIYDIVSEILKIPYKTY